MKLFHVKFPNENDYLTDARADGDDGHGNFSGMEYDTDSDTANAAKLPQGMAEYFADLFDGEVEEI